jgi:hypothetical protein
MRYIGFTTHGRFPRGFVSIAQFKQIGLRNLGYLEPFSRCLGAGLMESSAGDQMAPQIEMIVDDIVNRQKSLH